MGTLHRDDPDTADGSGEKLRRACERVEQCYDDRWPARGLANIRGRDYPPLDNVSRQGRQREYLRRPDAGDVSGRRRE